MEDIISTITPAPGKPKSMAHKTKSQLQDDSIMGTNNSSIVSKRSVERLYFPDEPHYFRHFVKKPQRRAPLINRGYWLRMKAIDHVVHQFLEQASEKKRIVINLGCGYDPLPWQCLSRYPVASQQALFIDIDYKDLMIKKHSVVNSTDHLRSVFTNVQSPNGEIFFQSDQYIQIGCDLRDLAGLQKALAKVADVKKSSFLLVAEVSITYMDMESADALIKWAATLPNAKFCLLEQLLPAGIHHPFAQTMMAHFKKLKTHLHSVESYPTTSAQENRFRNLGWQKAIAQNLWELWGSAEFLTSEERKSLDFVEPFDEWEEFALFGCHYVLLVASTSTSFDGSINSSDSGVESPVVESGEVEPSLPLSISYSEYPKGRASNRFASAIPIRGSIPDRGLFGVFAGMGLTTRTNSIDVYSSCTDVPFIFSNDSASAFPSARMCHTSTDIGDVGTLVVGGRISPDKALADCWLYHKWLNIWERVEDLPAARYRHQTVHLGSGHVLVTPGRANSQTISSDYLIWHRKSGWRKCALAAPAPSVYGSAAFLTNDARYQGNAAGAKLGILAGGMSEDGIVQDSVWEWELIGLHNEAPLLVFKRMNWPSSQISVARFGASTASLDGSTFIVGGVIKDKIINIDQEIYSVRHRDSCPQKVKLDLTNVARPLLIGTTLVSTLDQIVVAGGSAVCFSFGTFWNNGCYTLSPMKGSVNTGPTLVQHSVAQKTAWKFRQTMTATMSRGLKVPTILQVQSAEQILAHIIRIRVRSSDEFRAVVQAGKPMILEGSEIGSCTSLWSAEYLKERVGNKQVVVHKSTAESMNFVAKNFSYETKEFGDFLDQVTAGQRVYLRSLSAKKPSELPADIGNDFPTIAPDFRLPPELSLVMENMHSSPLRISGGVSMWLHYDVMANVLCQVHGTKRLLLFPPSDIKYFGFEPGSSSSSADVFNNLNQYSESHPHEAILNPGDILYLPALWLHAASPGEGMSISVNVFFRNLPSGYSTGRDIYGNRDLQAYEKGRQDIQKILKSFDGLPMDVRGFYLRRLADEFEEKAR